MKYYANIEFVLLHVLELGTTYYKKNACINRSSHNKATNPYKYSVYQGIYICCYFHFSGYVSIYKIFGMRSLNNKTAIQNDSFGVVRCTTGPNTIKHIATIIFSVKTGFRERQVC